MRFRVYVNESLGSYRLKSYFYFVIALSVLVGCGLKKFDNLAAQNSLFGTKNEAKVDRYFKLTPSFPTGVSGPYSISGKPDWLAFDSVTGEMTGYPDANSVSTTVLIRPIPSPDTNKKKVIIPISIDVVGDPLLAQQWGQQNKQQTGYAFVAGKADQDLNVRPVILSGVTGEGVKIAVSDEGLDINHEDLKSNVIPGASKNYDPAGPSSDPSIVSPTSDNPFVSDHGTSVAGIIAMTGWNRIGGRGISPNAKIAGLNFIRYQNETSFIDQISGPFDIVNQSWGISDSYFIPEDPVYRRALESGVTNLRNGKGTIFVKAAGNEFGDEMNSAMDPFNNNPQTIVVGAINAEGVHSSYSSAGANLWVSGVGGEYGGDKNLRDMLLAYVADLNNSANSRAQAQFILNFPAFFSPAIVTTDNSGCDRGYSHQNAVTSLVNAAFSIFNFDRAVGKTPGPYLDNQKCDYTSTFNGTSAATPSVTGVIALMLEKRPSLTWRDIKYILAKTARKIDPNSVNIIDSDDPQGHVNEPGWIRNQANFNFHNYYGFGLVDAAQAVTLAGSYTNSFRAFQSPQDFLMDTVENGGIDIPDNNAAGISRTIQALNQIPAFIEAVEIEVTIEHPYPANLSLELKSPSGTKSTFYNSNKFPPCQTVTVDGKIQCNVIPDLTAVKFLTNAFYGESGSGNWDLKVVDAKANNVGKLKEWKIRISGN